MNRPRYLANRGYRAGIKNTGIHEKHKRHSRIVCAFRMHNSVHQYVPAAFNLSFFAATLTFADSLFVQGIVQRNGELVGAVAIDASKELMLISDGGTLVRTRASEVAQTGRNAQGVRLIRLGENETLVGVEAIEAVEEDDELLDDASLAASAELAADDEIIAENTENESDLNEPEED